MTNLEQTLIPALEHVEEGLAVPAPILLVCFLRVDGHLCPDLWNDQNDSVSKTSVAAKASESISFHRFSISEQSEFGLNQAESSRI